MQRGQVVKPYEKALQFIKIRPHHSGELRRKLLMRKYPPDEISATIERLQAEGLLNDESFGLNFLESLKRYKTYGYYGIKAKLMSRGVTSNEAENLLKAGLSMEEESGIGQKIVRREKNPDKMRLAQKLSRKGFRPQVITELLGSLGEFVV